MERAVNELDLRPLLDRSIFELSGGEKQRIACGSVSTLSPEVMVLDEPTSNLDFPGIESLRNIIKLWKSQGRTVIIAEQRLHFLKDIADRVIYMESGEIRERFSGSEFFAKPAVFFEEHGLRAPELSAVFGREYPEHKPAGMFSLRDFSYSYKNGSAALDIPNAQLPLGSVIAIIGSNGAGKTTFMRSFCGLLRRGRGTLETSGKTLNSRKRIKCCYLVMQDVNHQLFTESVLDEVLLSMDNEDIPAAEEILRSLELSDLKELHPMSLSGGQKQRAAIASAPASGREFIVFDEPTSGLDAGHMQQAADCILSLKNQCRNVMIVTHDPEFISRCCDYAVRIEHGDMQANSRQKHCGEFSLPLKHYHGLTVGFDISQAEQSLPHVMEGFSVDLRKLRDKFCANDKIFVMRAGKQIEHIFSELYDLPEKVRQPYFKIKVLELLLFLDALEIPADCGERQYFYKAQIDKARDIVTLLTSNLERWYTLEEISGKFDFPLTSLKKCFQGIYGCSITAYMKEFRMNAAAGMLKRTDEPIISIASRVGYDNPGKFAAAFRSVLGVTPSEYRRLNA